MWLIVDGLVPVVWAGGLMVAGGDLGAALGPIVDSLTGAFVWELLGVARVVIRVRIIGLADGVPFVVTREVRVVTVVCVVGVSELEVVAAI